MTRLASYRLHSPCFWRLLAATLFVPLLASAAVAGVIEPAYEIYLTRLPDDAQISVLFFLAGQVPVRRPCSNFLTVFVRLP